MDGRRLRRFREDTRLWALGRDQRANGHHEEHWWHAERDVDSAGDRRDVENVTAMGDPDAHGDTAYLGDVAEAPNPRMPVPAPGAEG